MLRRRALRLVVAVLLGGCVILPGLAACGEDRPGAVMGLAESPSPEVDVAPAEEQPASDGTDGDVPESQWPVDLDPGEDAPEGDVPPSDAPETEPVEQEPVEQEPAPGPVEGEVAGAGPPPEDLPAEDVPAQDVPAQEVPVEDDLVTPPLDSDVVQDEAPIDAEVAEESADAAVSDDLEADVLDEQLTMLMEELDEQEQDELLRALEDVEPDGSTSDGAGGSVANIVVGQADPVTAAESLQVESTPIGPVATVNVLTDTRPVGPRLSVTVGLRSGETAAGAPIVVLGEGLAPGTPVTVTVHSVPQLIASGVVDDDGSAALDAAVPTGLDAGPHAVDVRATGADGTAVQSIGAFTIDADSVVDDVAPMGELLDPIPVDDPTLERALRAGVAVYDPARYPTVTVAAAIMAVAVVGLAGVSRLASMPVPGSPSGGPPAPAPSPGQPRGPVRLSRMNTRSLTSPEEGRQGWGDRRGTWRVPGTAAVDRMVPWVALRLGRVTELGSRILVDGEWARAMGGSAGLLLWLVAAVLGLLAASSVGFGAFPPAAPLLLAIVGVGILDAAAGVVAWSVLPVGVVITGQLGGWDDVRTLLGLFALYAAIPLAANALRPLRRAPAGTAKERFDRFADYIAMPVLIAWAGTSMLLALNGLSGLELVDDDLLGPIRWTIAVALIVRLSMEDVAAHGYPARTEAVQPPKGPARSMPVQLGSVAVRVGVFVLVIAPFAGVGAVTMVAAALTAVPMLLRTVQDRMVNVPALHRYFPRGMASRLLTLVVAIYLSAWLLGRAATSEQTPEMFAWLLVPGIVVGIIATVGRDGRDWPDAWPKRAAGSLVWIALAGLTVGAITLPLP